MTERSFQPLASPDEVTLSGTRLIEAGAGTGKTWTVVALVLRLLLERKLAIDEILIVTYTRAATGELRGRIRTRLAEAFEAFVAGQSEDKYLAALLLRHAHEADEAKARLRLALESFDTAAIHTIHGFCQRALAESALAAGQPFERELVPETAELIAAVARDVWRKAMATASPLWAAWLMDKLGGPEALASRVRAHVGRITAQIDAPPSLDCVAAERAYAEVYATARRLWQTEAAEILAWLKAAKLHKNSYPPDKLAARGEALAAWFGREQASLPLPKEAVHFSRSKIQAACTNASPEPTHPFFAAMDELLAAHEKLADAFEDSLRHLARTCLEEARAALEAQKRSSGRQTYDDLLVDLARALQGDGGPALIESLRARYRAALVDEFQDTDLLQLSVFMALFGDETHPLIFVGDPKQAIYAFRGADVFAYLAAREQAQEGYALLGNRRSDEPLIDAVNALFSRPRPFLLDMLPFVPAKAAEQTDRKTLFIDDGLAPLTLWYLPAPKEEQETGKAKAEQWLAKELASELSARAVAGDIARLLRLSQEGRARRNGRPLAGGDIAVLVRTRRQGELVRQQLGRLGIQSVAIGGGSIWQSEEAEELERLLLAVAEPWREGLVRAALATVLLGASAGELAAWSADEAAWSARLERFHDDRRELETRGFAAFWHRLMRREDIVPRLLARPDGERRLTNYRHLAELLQAAEAAQALDATGLARHLAAQRRAPEVEEHQLRLESDEALVRIVTIHAAKGLQYPIVYCPFLWDGRKEDVRRWPVLAHDEGGAWLDFGSPKLEARRRAADLEAAAEELRLAYVALTRAEHRCVLIWGKAKFCERSPLAWLLFGPRETIEAEPRAWLANELEKISAAALIEKLRKWAEPLQGKLAIAPLPEEAAVAPRALPAATPRLEARPFRATIPAPWRIASFSSLVARLAEAEAPDHDAHAPLPALGSEAVLPAPILQEEARPDQPVALEYSSIFAFPRGARAGSCLHALFERCDFRDRSRLGELAAQVLAEFGFAAAWQPVLERLVADVLAVPLLPGLRLADVGLEDRLAELEFTYPLAGGGYMKGFIDLIFRHGGRWFIVDWKSNWLGDTPEDYSRGRLEEAMRTHRYDLQLNIYAAALKRALAAREPGLDWEAAFGGVFYLFVRGMRPGSDHGVYFARPGEAEIAAAEVASC
ncbi:MAG: exodeoxyribonuclease V subunit beta [Rhodocyclaceae bacterium]|nr:exodeoxyribonuclease V subunit beta [Rhodocyclaceae bacterium]